jgi:hypothetical protein
LHIPQYVFAFIRIVIYGKNFYEKKHKKIPRKAEWWVGRKGREGGGLSVGRIRRLIKF